MPHGRQHGQIRMEASQIRILAFAGSAHRGSLNKKTVSVAVDGARAAGAQVTVIDLRDYPLPLFDQDVEALEGVPANAVKLKELFKSHHGFLIACPEYNVSVTPLLKNLIDWVSRKTKDEPLRAAFKGKAAALMAASPGASGGSRGMAHLREILEYTGVVVLPRQVALPKADEAFDPDGTLKDPGQKASLRDLGSELVQFLAKTV